jgi:inorganic pyrophosphatase
MSHVRPLLLLLLLAVGCAQPDLWRDPELRAGAGRVQVVVEIPAGTNAKWEVDKVTGRPLLEQRDGGPRVVDYLPYPANYGLLPRTLLPEEQGGDGDPLDVVLLGPARPRGAVVPARPVAVLRLFDEGARDDKILAVDLEGPLGSVNGLEELEERYPGVSAILQTWFTSYKGPGRMQSNGIGDAAEAWFRIDEAARAYAARQDVR